MSFPPMNKLRFLAFLAGATAALETQAKAHWVEPGGNTSDSRHTRIIRGQFSHVRKDYGVMNYDNGSGKCYGRQIPTSS
jgi:hypothetical protein